MRPIDQAIEKLTIEDLYPQLTFDKGYRAECLFHNSKSGNSFNVTDDKKWFCKGCGKSGDPIDWWYSIEKGILGRCPGGETFNQIAKQIQELAGITVDKTSQKQPSQHGQVNREAVLRDIYEYCHQKLLEDTPQAEAARDYLQKRLVSLETIKKLKIGLYPSYYEIKDYITGKTQKNHYYGKNQEDGVYSMKFLLSKYEDYLTFPWWDENDKPLTMYFRYPAKELPKDKDKTLTFPGEGSKRSPLYLNFALKKHVDLIAVEGLIDAASLIDQGVENVITYVGSNFSNEQIQTMQRKKIQSIKFVGDADDGGINGLKSSTPRLINAGIDVYAVALPKGTDPNDILMGYGLESWVNCIEKNTSAISTIVDQALEKFNEIKPDDKTKSEIINTVREELSKINSDDKSTNLKVDLFGWEYLRMKLIEMGVEPLAEGGI